MRTLKITLFALLFFVTANLSAQTVALGPKAGYVTTTFQGEDARDRQFGSGFNVGAFMSVSPGSGVFTFQPELLFTQKKAVRSAAGFTETLKINYLEIPAAFKLAIPINGSVFPNIYIGPYTAIKMKANSEYTLGDTVIGSTEKEYRTVDFGAIMGAGLDFKGESGVFTVDFRYHLSGTQLETAENADDLKYGSFSINAGFGFWLNNGY